MANFTKRNLKCKDTEKFLESKGFHLYPSIKYSKWANGYIQLKLDDETTILNETQLYEQISISSYNEGLLFGKQMALITIQDHLKKMVFPADETKTIVYAA